MSDSGWTDELREFDLLTIERVEAEESIALTNKTLKRAGYKRPRSVVAWTAGRASQLATRQSAYGCQPKAIISAALWAIAMTGALVLPLGVAGLTDASAM